MRHRLAALLTAVGGGDRDAFTALYRQTSRRVFGMALRIVHHGPTAEEIAQEVYMQVWTLAGRYDEQMSSPMAWLTMLTHRRAVDRLRADRTAVDRESRYGRAYLGRDHDMVTAEVEQTLEEQQVRRCLARLTPLQRDSIVLAYYGGLTYPQVAERLGTPVATVKSRIREGLKRLAASLEEKGHRPDRFDPADASNGGGGSSPSRRPTYPANAASVSGGVGPRFGPRQKKF